MDTQENAPECLTSDLDRETRECAPEYGNADCGALQPRKLTRKEKREINRARHLQERREYIRACREAMPNVIPRVRAPADGCALEPRKRIAALDMREVKARQLAVRIASGEGSEAARLALNLSPSSYARLTRHPVFRAHLAATLAAIENAIIQQAAYSPLLLMSIQAATSTTPPPTPRQRARKKA